MDLSITTKDYCFCFSTTVLVFFDLFFCNEWKKNILHEVSFCIDRKTLKKMRAYCAADKYNLYRENKRNQEYILDCLDRILLVMTTKEKAVFHFY